ncbi:hypothetical protein [Antribacter gilvus]|uniref:hypothetical protein n=1 Tax=Antribacter gilvus TaxID=2304675 RepID=UPI000F79492A|nr:hypothetical protein [Antribacter gilvus]
MPATVGYWSDVAMVFSMVGAGLGAWLTVVQRQDRHREWAAAGSRTQWERVRHVVLACASSVATSMTASLLVGVVLTMSAGGDPWVGLGTSVLWWYGTVIAGVAFALLGALVGWWTRHLVAVVVAPALTYCLVVAPMMTLDPPLWSGLAAAQGLSWIEVAPSTTSVVLRAIFWSSMVVLLACALGGVRRLQAGFAVALSLTTSFGMLEGPVLRPIEGATDVVCVGEGPTTCTTRPWAAGLNRFADVLGQGLALVPPALAPPLISTSLAAGRAPEDSGLVVEPVGGTTAPTNRLDRDATLVNFGEGLFAAECSAGSDPLAMASLLTWWRLELGIPVDRPVLPGDAVLATILEPGDYRVVVESAGRMLALDPERRLEWLESHAEKVRTCSLTMSDLP